MSCCSSLRERSFRSARTKPTKLAREVKLYQQDKKFALQYNYQSEVSTQSSLKRMPDHQMMALRSDMRKMFSEVTEPLKLEMRKMISEATEPLKLGIKQLGKKVDQSNQKVQRSLKRIQRIQQKIGSSSESPIKPKSPVKEQLGPIKQNEKEEEEDKQENKQKGFQIVEKYSFSGRSGQKNKTKLVRYEHQQKLSQRKYSNQNQNFQKKEEKSKQKIKSLPITSATNIKSFGYQNGQNLKASQIQRCLYLEETEYVVMMAQNSKAKSRQVIQKIKQLTTKKV